VKNTRGSELRLVVGPRRGTPDAYSDKRANRTMCGFSHVMLLNCSTWLIAVGSPEYLRNLA
jgi:hypothetical protein